MKTARTTALLAAALALGGAAHALVDATDPARILSMAKGYGTATLGKDSDGNPVVNASIDGLKYSIYFYGCTRAVNCTSIQFSAYWDSGNTTYKKVNDWNAAKRFGKAFIDDDDLVLDMDVNLDGGVADDNLDDTFGFWRIVLKDFRDNVVNK